MNSPFYAGRDGVLGLNRNVEASWGDFVFGLTLPLTLPFFLLGNSINPDKTTAIVTTIREIGQFERW